MAIVCIDFDNTVVNGHTHNTITQKISMEKATAQPNNQLDVKSANIPSETESDKLKQWNLVKDFKPRVGAEDWKNLINKLIKEGHTVAMVSFNAFDHIIETYLERVIGLDPETMKKIIFNSWLPEEPEDSNKNKHIDEVVMFAKDLNIEFNDQVMLIDDTRRNTMGAKEDCNCAVVWANPADNNFFDEIDDKLNELIASNKKYRSPGSESPLSTNESSISIIATSASEDEGPIVLVEDKSPSISNTSPASTHFGLFTPKLSINTSITSIESNADNSPISATPLDKNADSADKSKSSPAQSPKH